MERTLEELEKQSWDKINVALKNNEAQEEQDDSVICDVCRSVSPHMSFVMFVDGLIDLYHWRRLQIGNSTYAIGEVC